MAILKGDLQDDLGNILYPNTSYDLVANAPQIKKTVSDLSTMTDEVLLKNIITIAKVTSAFIKLPLDYAGFVTVRSSVKGEYFETFLVQIKNKYAYSATPLSAMRFNNTAAEIGTSFIQGGGGAEDSFVYLMITNNTATSGTFWITLTQNINGGI